MNQELQKKSFFTTRNLTSMAVMAALAVVLVSLIHFPLLPAAPFMEYDPGNIPLFIVAFAFGPVPGFVLTVIVSVIQGVTVSASSGIIGIIMHIAATGTAMLVAGSIYKRNKTKKNAVLSLVLSVLTMTGVMVIMNLIFTPIFMDVPIETVVGMIVPIILPFNLIKASLNAVIAFALYKTVGKLFKDNWARKRAKELEPSEQEQ
ncbi:MAG: ECF transporter S component [Christensenellaceae bacterium]|jgi:riboflavin transporter FmnP